MGREIGEKKKKKNGEAKSALEKLELVGKIVDGMVDMLREEARWR